MSSSSSVQPLRYQKIKASNFDATTLRIGSWQRVAKYEGDLVAKCYYAKRKLVWEVLDGGLKSKIEIDWKDISAIRAVFHKNHPDVLELELSDRPKYKKEINPVPGKHTIWTDSEDFTGEQATINRIHYLQFPEGTLEKHYEKILQCDSQLNTLSRSRFPSSNCSFFVEHAQDIYANGHQSAMLQHPLQLGLQRPNIYGQHNNFHSVAARPPLIPRNQMSRTIQGTGNVQLMDQGFGNLGIQQPMHMPPFLEQRTTHENVYVNPGAGGHQVQEPSYFSHMNQPCKHLPHDSFTEVSNEPVGSGKLMDGIINHLFDEQTATTVDPSYEHPTLLARIKSWDNCLLPLPSDIKIETHENTCSDFSYLDTCSFMEPAYVENPELMVQPFLPANFEPPVEDVKYPTDLLPKLEFMVEPLLPTNLEPPFEDIQYPTNCEPQIGDVQYPTNTPGKPFY
ncbi:hypothetical protein MKW94_024877 [Papaver nudicaule]|uniref:TRF2/HOY1 PH-like domain-containing protein n=1 Tax=Papaver nudicaule TaxID=74823 RepID=A0AA41V4Y9_PAPNU|nr:hypothetical protein [Papaver nudicaule]